MSMTKREQAARAIGFLEGFGTWVWDHVGEELSDEYADCYDEQINTLRKIVFDEEIEDERGN